jgi:hypothetical protein
MNVRLNFNIWKKKSKLNATNRSVIDDKNGGKLKG